MMRFVLPLVLLCAGGTAARLFSQDHAHHHHGGNATETPVERPKVFLDKSPRVVAYQLKRLDNRALAAGGT